MIKTEKEINDYKNKIEEKLNKLMVEKAEIEAEIKTGEAYLLTLNWVL